MRIIFESVLMLFTQIIKISRYLMKIQLAKVGSFFETQCMFVACSNSCSVVHTAV